MRCVHVCVRLYEWRPARRKTRVATLPDDTYVSGEYANLDIEVSDVNSLKCVTRCGLMWRSPSDDRLLFHVRACGDNPVLWR